ncbi:hypothetical protein [Teichococcus deserti]|nr:hypothetical protein [Pseudoroseomonas deserti]
MPLTAEQQASLQREHSEELEQAEALLFEMDAAALRFVNIPSFTDRKDVMAWYINEVSVGTMISTLSVLNHYKSRAEPDERASLVVVIPFYEHMVNAKQLEAEMQEIGRRPHL